MDRAQLRAEIVALEAQIQQLRTTIVQLEQQLNAAILVRRMLVLRSLINSFEAAINDPLLTTPAAKIQAMQGPGVAAFELWMQQTTRYVNAMAHPLQDQHARRRMLASKADILAILRPIFGHIPNGDWYIPRMLQAKDNRDFPTTTPPAVRQQWGL